MQKIEIKIARTINKRAGGQETLEVFQPHAPGPDATALINSIGHDAYQTLVTIECIKKELSREDGCPPHIHFQLIKGFVSALVTENPHHIHFEIAQAAIEQKSPKWAKDASKRDMVAREIIVQCQKLIRKLIIPEKIKITFEAIKKECDVAALQNGYSKNPALEIYEVPSDLNLEASFEKQDVFLWDWALLESLKQTGPAGKKLAQEGVAKCKARLVNFKKGAPYKIEFWIDTDLEHISNAIELIAEAIVEDIIKPRAQYKEENVSALTTKTQAPLKKLFSPYNEIKEEKNKNLVTIYNSTEKTFIGQIRTPAMTEQIVKAVINGVKKLNTVTGHRTLRHLVNSAFHQKASGIYDFRLLRYDRGVKEIAEYLKMQSHRQSKEIGEILQALAYFEFHCENFTGNLISLTQVKSPISLRNDALLITVGAPLLPGYTFTDHSLLIPVPHDPPLVNPNQTHAGQYLLQMEVMEDFSKQSIQLKEDGVIQIPQKLWEEHAIECKLSPDVLKKVQDRWTRDGTDGARFLTKVEDNFYTLGQEYKSALEFLIQQGELRKKASNMGVASAKRKKFNTNQRTKS